MKAVLIAIESEARKVLLKQTFQLWLDGREGTGDEDRSWLVILRVLVDIGRSDIILKFEIQEHFDLKTKDIARGKNTPCNECVCIYSSVCVHVCMCVYIHLCADHIIFIIGFLYQINDHFVKFIVHKCLLKSAILKIDDNVFSVIAFHIQMYVQFSLFIHSQFYPCCVITPSLPQTILCLLFHLTLSPLLPHLPTLHLKVCTSINDTVHTFSSSLLDIHFRYC